MAHFDSMLAGSFSKPCVHFMESTSYLYEGSYIYIYTIIKTILFCTNRKRIVEMPGIEPGTFHMQSERSTAELQPHLRWTF